MLVCVDNGYSNTKVKVGTKEFNFPSRWEKTNDTSENGILEYIGDLWVNRGRDEICLDKTKSQVHKLSTLKALGEVVDYSQEIDLIVDLPLAHYRNKEFRESFKDYMQTPSIDYFNYLGKPKEIKINTCTVAPQGVTALYSQLETYKDKLVGVIDLGGFTIDCSVVENLEPLTDTIFTINKGDKIIESELKTKLNEKYLLNLQDYEMGEVMRKGIPSIPQSEKFIADTIKESFIELFREFRVKNWSLETLDIVVVGGGAYKYTEILAEEINNISVIPDPLYANVRGLHKMGVILHG